jgi:uncharacterized protein
MTAYHRIPADLFTALASGLGGPAAIRQLAGVRHSKHLLLLRLIVDAYAADRDGDGAVDVLVEAERRGPSAVADLITDPMVGAWAARTTRRLVGDVGGGTGAPVAADVAQFGALAAAAALRTGLDAELRTYALGCTVTLPTLGGAALGADGPAVVAISAGRATVTGQAARVTVGAEEPGWHETRRLTADHDRLGISVALEDGNPYRDCYHAPPAERLSADEVLRWREVFAEAWSLLVGHLPERAAELATGLRSMVPLFTEHDGMARSGTARDAFGTLGLTRPRSAAELAVTLVHEFQHSKLSVLLGVVPLYTPGGAERHFAPWRTDPRPTGGLIQGVYAFLGVADTWRALRSAPGLEESATREFAFAREQVEVGLGALEGSAELTSEGREFASELRKVVDRLRTEEVAQLAAKRAAETLQNRRHTWQLHNPEIAWSSPANDKLTSETRLAL